MNLLNSRDPAVRTVLVENTVDLLSKLRDETGFTTALAVMADDENKGIVLASLEGRSDHIYLPRPGFHFHLHCTAPGKAFLAFLPRARRSKILAEISYESFTPHTFHDRKTLKAAVERHARQGYAVDVSEYVERVNCVATCIPWNENGPLAAIWITALSIDLPETRLGEYAGKVIATAREMEIRLRNVAEDPASQLNATIEHSRHFIELHFLDEKSIHEHIENLGISEKWFRSAFCEKYGMTPLKFRQTLVLERAQRLLKNTNLSIKEIAFQLGYDNQNYFSRTFKVHVGQSPEIYRRRRKRAVV